MSVQYLRALLPAEKPGKKCAARGCKRKVKFEDRGNRPLSKDESLGDKWPKYWCSDHWPIVLP